MKQIKQICLLAIGVTGLIAIPTWHGAYEVSPMTHTGAFLMILILAVFAALAAVCTTINIFFSYRSGKLGTWLLALLIELIVGVVIASGFAGSAGAAPSALAAAMSFGGSLLLNALAILLTIGKQEWIT